MIIWLSKCNGLKQRTLQIVCPWPKQKNIEVKESFGCYNIPEAPTAGFKEAASQQMKENESGKGRQRKGKNGNEGKEGRELPGYGLISV